MKISIIPQDNRIIVDGKTIDLDDNDVRWTFDDEHIHAIQWRDNKGEIEYEDRIDEDPLPNKIFGENEFDIIIQPYLNFFNSFLSEFEKKFYKEKVSEEKKQLEEIEKLNISKMQEEENINFIQNLQEQNKKIREEYKNLADELEQVLEEKSISEGRLRLDESKRLLEKEEEIKSLELKKSDEYMQENSSKFAERIESLYEDLEEQRNSFVEEKKQWIEYIQKYRDSLEDEVKQIEESYKEDIKTREIKDQLVEKRILLEEENIDALRQSIEIEKLSLEQQMDEVRSDRLIKNKQKQKELENLELERQKIQLEREKALNEIMIQQESILMDEDLTDQRNAVLDSIQKEEDLQEIGSKTVKKLFDQNQKFNDEFSERKSKLSDLSNRIVDERNAIEFGNEEVGSIVDFIDKINPEDFYNFVTDSERKSNSFPVGKASKWFNELRDLLESYDYDDDEDDDEDEDDEE